MDTAGIRKTDDLVESIGVQKALQSMDAADLILCVIDASRALDSEDMDILDYIRDKDVKTLFLLNKADLATVVRMDEILNSMPEDKRECLSISALTHMGIRELTKRIEELFSLGDLTYNDEITVSSMRHEEQLIKADSSMESVERSVAEGLPEDFYTVDLMDAYTSLGRIIGEDVDDDLVNEIFSKFCMGK